MPRINPHVGLFVAVAAPMVALFGWLRSDMAAMGARLEERMTRIEDRIEGVLAFARGRAFIEPGPDSLRRTPQQ